MAKRARGGTRPGQMRPSARPTKRPAGTAPATTQAASTPAATAAPVATDVADPVPAAAPRTASAATTAAARTRGPATQPSGLLQQRAAQEYAYVARDVRHIVWVAGGLMIVLAVLWFLIDVLGIIKL